MPALDASLAHCLLREQFPHLAGLPVPRVELDWGTSAVGDPACDLVIAWTFLSGPSRALFRDAVDVEPGAWARAKGWALWKALLTVADSDNELPVADSRDEERAGGTAEFRYGWRCDARTLVADLLADSG